MVYHSLRQGGGAGVYFDGANFLNLQHSLFSIAYGKTDSAPFFGFEVSLGVLEGDSLLYWIFGNVSFDTFPPTNLGISGAFALDELSYERAGSLRCADNRKQGSIHGADF
jgi:hypothetical protein